MRISTKIGIALIGTLIAFAIFIGLSQYTISEVQMQERRLNRLNVISHEISNVVIGNRIFQDRMTGEEYVEDALGKTERALLEVLAETDPMETVLVEGMLSRLEEFSGVFRRLVQSKQFLADLDQDVRAKVIDFGVRSLELQDFLDERYQTMRGDPEVNAEEMERLQGFIFANTLIWGWVNRAISVIDRDLLLQNDLKRFQENFRIAREAYEERFEALEALAIELDVPQISAYVDTLRELMADLRAVSVEFTVAATVERESREILENHGLRLREMVEQLVERSGERSEHLIWRLSVVYWLSALVLLAGAVGLSAWFSVSISRPLNRLARNFSEVAGGHFGLHISATGGGEIGDLARAFNDMTDKLRKSYSEVEERVRQRTEELQLATERAKKLAEAAQGANIAKSAFLATMSHEIRTPLNSIIGFSEMLEDTNLNEEQRSDLAAIRSSGAVLLGLINEILDLSKIEAGKVHLEVKAVDLEQIVHDVTSTFTLPAQRKGVSVDVEVSEELQGKIVYSDRTRLQQLLNNLLSNAVKFTSEGSVRIKVWRDDRGESQGPRYYISVTDTGIGIPEDKQEDVFLAFTQADSSTTRKFGGTGLGLAICQRIVEMLGGDISVTSQLGVGSTFTFYFRDAGGDGQKQESVDGAMMEELIFNPPPRILVAEDDEANYNLTRKILNRLGVVADWAKDGRAAVARAKEVQYDLILMDLQMPEIDGVEATYAIREHYAGREQPYIAALTANALGESREACKKAGMQDFVTKPVCTDAIKAALLKFKRHSPHWRNG